MLAKPQMIVRNEKRPGANRGVDLLPMSDV
jgi:hypothetical protein